MDSYYETDILRFRPQAGSLAIHRGFLSRCRLVTDGGFYFMKRFLAVSTANINLWLHCLWSGLRNGHSMFHAYDKTGKTLLIAAVTGSTLKNTLKFQRVFYSADSAAL